MTVKKGKHSRRSGRGDEDNAGSPLSGAMRERFGLTRMEALVACALADGLTYEEIAERHRISYHTVHSHVKAIHEKAKVTSNARLLALIRKEGWK